MSTNRFLLRASALAATAGAIGLATASPAAAHVTANVYGDQPEKGGYGAVVLRVPNEEQAAGTTKVEVTFPAEYAISSVRTKPVPGWTVEIAKSDIVSKVTWTARPGSEIPAGTTSYQEFEFTAGPLPEDVDQLVLPSKQTYSDNSVVDWSQPPSAGGEEPEHPAPVVALAEPSGAGHGAPQHGSATDSEASTGDDTARWLGGAGLAVGALGLGVGTGAALWARKQVAK